MDSIEKFIKDNRISEIECLLPDMSGIARGKILPADKFLRVLGERGIGIPEHVFVQSVTGEYPEEDRVTHPRAGDVYMVPDPESLRVIPWYSEPTAQVICDAVYEDNSPVEFASRYVLKRVLECYYEKGWRPIVAPELEFFLVQRNNDPDLPLKPALGSSGRSEGGRQAFGIDAVNEYDDVLDLLYDYCEVSKIDIDTLVHEVGAAQVEINLDHGDPLSLADQVFLFKRTARQAAVANDVFATFMARPISTEPGSAMHIHQSVLDSKNGENIFADDNGVNTKLFYSYIAGLQKYLPLMMPLFAPNMNSYRRFTKYSDAPINVHWGYDNRTVSFRVPVSSRKDRRVENRVPGADCNPYHAIAATLACGYLGMVAELEPSAPVEDSAHERAHRLPRHLFDALNSFSESAEIKDMLGEKFVQALVEVKELEYYAYQAVVSPWEREVLLLNV